MFIINPASGSARSCDGQRKLGYPRPIPSFNALPLTSNISRQQVVDATINEQRLAFVFPEADPSALGSLHDLTDYYFDGCLAVLEFRRRRYVFALRGQARRQRGMAGVSCAACALIQAMRRKPSAGSQRDVELDADQRGATVELQRLY